MRAFLYIYISRSLCLSHPSSTLQYKPPFSITPHRCNRSYTGSAASPSASQAVAVPSRSPDRRSSSHNECHDIRAGADAAVLRESSRRRSSISRVCAPDRSRYSKESELTTSPTSCAHAPASSSPLSLSLSSSPSTFLSFSLNRASGAVKVYTVHPRQPAMSGRPLVPR
jgi:hypothetical protein